MANDSKLLEIFLASTIHEAKNHLGHLNETIEGNCAQSISNPQFQEAKAQINALSHLLTQVLVHYRGVQMGYQLHTDQVDLEDFLEEVAIRHAPLACSKNINLETTLSCDAPAFFDEQMIRNVVDTLLSNAISAGATLIQLTISDEDKDFVTFHVTDNGPGFPEDLLAQGLESLKPSQAQENKTGLGLYLASQIIGAHQSGGKSGHMVLSNLEQPAGARVTFKLP